MLPVNDYDLFHFIHTLLSHCIQTMDTRKAGSERRIRGPTWRRRERVIRDRAISVIVEVSFKRRGEDVTGERKGEDAGWCDVRTKLNMCALMRK